MNTLKDEIVLITGAGKGRRAKAHIDDIAKKVAVQNIIHQMGRIYASGCTRIKPHGIQVYAIENVQAKIVETILTRLDLQMEER